MTMSAVRTAGAADAGKPLRITLWAAQIVGALLFCGAGATKLFVPIDQLAQQMPWTATVAPAVVRAIALVDLAGGIGLLLPSLTRILPRLTVWAAVGCTLLQICAIIFHVTRQEFDILPLNAVFLGVSLFILWGRSKRVPIAPR